MISKKSFRNQTMYDNIYGYISYLAIKKIVLKMLKIFENKPFENFPLYDTSITIYSMYGTYT